MAPSPAAPSSSIFLDREAEERMHRLAVRKDQPSDSLVREAITQYLEREETREALHADALKAWEAFQDDGLHLGAGEAEAWLERLESGDDADPPACHD